MRVSEEADALARRALPAKIVREFFAIRRFREHASQREFADAARAREKESMRDALAAQRATERSDDAFIAKKFREAHGLTALHRGIHREERFDRRQDFFGNFFRRTHDVAETIEALDRDPRRLARELVVHFRRFFEMAWWEAVEFKFNSY